MAQIVLVHGAWHGAWCWRRVIQPLVQAGHHVHAVTLTGVGERAHLLRPTITLDTHIADVLNAITHEEMSDVILVGHSYAGMLITAVADRIPNQIKHLVYVDAVVPESGESWSSTHAENTRLARLNAALLSPNNAFPPTDPNMFGLKDDDYEWVKRRQTPHPAQPYTAPLTFNAQRVGRIPRTFVSCTAPSLGTIDAIRPRVTNSQTWGGAWLPNSNVVEIKTGHDPMISRPQELAAILHDCA